MTLKKALYLNVLVWVFLSAAGAAEAPAMHWINLGAMADPDQAQALRERAAAALPDQVVIISEDTPKGRAYRVAGGPYMRRELAEQLLREARRSGFRDAWLSSAPLAAGMTGTDPVLPEAGAGVTDRYDAARADGFVDRAPAGHELHKLRRVGGAPDDG